MVKRLVCQVEWGEEGWSSVGPHIWDKAISSDIGISGLKSRSILVQIDNHGLSHDFEKVALCLFMKTPDGAELSESIIAEGNFCKELCCCHCGERKTFGLGARGFATELFRHKCNQPQKECHRFLEMSATNRGG